MITRGQLYTSVLSKLQAGVNVAVTGTTVSFKSPGHEEAYEEFDCPWLLKDDLEGFISEALDLFASQVLNDQGLEVDISLGSGRSEWNGNPVEIGGDFMFATEEDPRPNRFFVSFVIGSGPFQCTRRTIARWPTEELIVGLWAEARRDYELLTRFYAFLCKERIEPTIGEDFLILFGTVPVWVDRGLIICHEKYRGSDRVRELIKRFENHHPLIPPGPAELNDIEQTGLELG